MDYITQTMKIKLEFQVLFLELATENPMDGQVISFYLPVIVDREEKYEIDEKLNIRMHQRWLENPVKKICYEYRD